MSANKLRPEHGPEMVAAVVAAEGSCPQIAKRFGIAPSTVWRMKKRNGEPVAAHYTTTNPDSIKRREVRQAAAKEGAASRVSNAERARRMHQIDDDYARQHPADGRAGRCCGKCKTPYNCGNKDCQCHA